MIRGQGAVVTNRHSGKQALLERQVAECIKDSGKTLDILQKETGIHRAKLGRMRLCKCHVTFDEAAMIFSAVSRPSLALMALALLEQEGALTPETMAYLDNFLADLPDLLERLNQLGPTLNPKWAHGSAHHIGVLMAEHADRRLQAEAFAPANAARRLS